MAQNSLGQFIAALRKANGMTQQDVADRLNVSNKAVSRWERDECAPDISIIPALAEMFGVTCDELLKGERTTTKDFSEQKEKRTEKQVKAAVNRAISEFKSTIWISLAVAIVGLICMFGISYGFYRPVIGFVVMLLFEVCAFVIAVTAISKTKGKKSDNELFETMDAPLLSKFNNALGTLSFWACYVVFACVVISLPFIVETALYYVLHSYFTDFFGEILLFLTLVFLKCKEPFSAWISGEKLPEKPSDETAKDQRKTSVIQIVCTVLAGVLFVIAPYFETHLNDTPYFCIFLELAGFACLAANIFVFFAFLKRQKSDRAKSLTVGIRNILLIPSAWIMQGFHQGGWMNNPDTGMKNQRYEVWNVEVIGYAMALAAVVLILFSSLEAAEKRKKQKREE